MPGCLRHITRSLMGGEVVSLCRGEEGEWGGGRGGNSRVVTRHVERFVRSMREDRRW